MLELREQVGERYKVRLEKLAVARSGRVLCAKILFSVLSNGKPLEGLNRR